MSKRLCLLMRLLLVVIALGEVGAVDISNCGNLSNAGTYTLTANVRNDSTCFNIDADDVVLECAGYAVNYSKADPTAYGINISAGVNNVAIRNCNVQQENSFMNRYAIYIKDGMNINTTNTNVTVNADYSGVIIDDSVNTTLIGLIYNGESSGLGIQDSNFTTVTNSTVIGDNLVLQIIGSNRTILTNINVSGITNSIRVYNSSNTDIINSIITASSNTAIYFTDQSNNTRIINTNISSPGAGEVYFTVTNGYGRGVHYFINTTFNTSKLKFHNSSIQDEAYVQWYMDVHVNDSLGTALSGANVTAYNNDSNLTFSVLTNSSGNTLRQNVTEFMENGTSRYYETNYTVNASRTGYHNGGVSVNITASSLVVVTLNTEPTASVSISPQFPSLTDDLECEYRNLYDADGESITIVSYDWYNGATWLGRNDSELPTEFTGSLENWQCKVTLSDGNGNVDITSQVVSIEYGCLTGYAFSYEMVATGNYTLLNFTNITIINTNLSNIITDNEAYIYGNLSLLFNTTLDKNISIQIGGDLTNESYNNFTAVVPNQNISLIFNNLTQDYPFYTIDFREEETNAAWNLSTGSTLTLTLFCNEALASDINMKDWNNTVIRVPTKEVPDFIQAKIKYAGVSEYFRDAVPHSDYETIYLYMIDLDSYTAVYMAFTLQDFTTQFTDPVGRFRSYASGNVTEITSDWFGIDNILYVYLLDGVKYTVTVESGQLSRTIGWMFISSTDTSKTITISYVDIDQNNIYESASFGLEAEIPTQQIVFAYTDTDNGTQDVGLFIYNHTNDALLYEEHSALTNISMTYNAPDVNGTYRTSVIIQHGSYDLINQTVLLMFRNVSQRLIDVGLPSEGFVGFSEDTWYTLVSLFLITFAALSFGALHGGAGAIGVSLFTGFFYYIGWLPISNVLAMTIIAFAILSKMGEGR